MAALTWAALETPWDEWSTLYAIIEIDGRLVAGGFRNSDGKTIAYSDDQGATWTSVTNPFSGFLDIVYCFAYSPDRTTLVAGGSTNGGPTTLAYSLDQGETWADGGNPGNMSFIASIWRDDGDDLFVAGGVGVADECIATSADGQTWTPRSTPWDGGAFANGVCRAGGAIDLWIAVGLEPGFTPTKTAMQSTDGLTWTVMAPGPFDGQSSGYTAYGFGQAVTYDEVFDRVIAGAYSGDNALAWMDSSLLWTNEPSSLDGDVAYALDAAEGRIVAAGALGLVESTDGGVTWAFDPTTPWVSVDPAPSSNGALGVFLASGSTGYATGSDGDTLSVVLASGTAPTPTPAARTYVDGNWRIFVTSIESQTLSILDKRVSEGAMMFPLDAPAYLSGSVPADDPEINIPWPTDDDPANVTNNRRLIFALRREAGTPPYECRFGGIIMSMEDQGTDIPVSRFTAYDPWQYMLERPVRNPYTGALPTSDGLVFPINTRASDIALLLLEATETVDGNTFVDLTDLSLVEDTEPLPAPITFDAGLSVGEAWNQLVATGTIDIALPPIYDPIGRPGKVCMFQTSPMLGQVRFGAVMSWDRSIRTLMGISRLVDGTRLANRVQWFGINGQPVALQSDAASIAANGEYWAQQFFPDARNGTLLEAGALAELLIRRNGERTVSLDVAPEAPELSLRDYKPGDWLPVWASRNLREPIVVDYDAYLSDPDQPGAAGYMRIQAIPIALDDNGVETVTGLMLSKDGPGSGT